MYSLFQDASALLCSALKKLNMAATLIGENKQPAWP